MGLIRAVLILSNFILFVGGIFCTFVGAFILHGSFNEQFRKFTKILHFLENSDHMDLTPVAGVFLVGAGTALLVLAFLGCCGAAKEWRPLLYCYSFLLILILLLQGTAAVMALIVGKTGMQDLALKSLSSYEGSDHDHNDRPSSTTAAATTLSSSTVATTASPNVTTTTPSTAAKDPPPTITELWNALMEIGHCCGVTGQPSDFNHSIWANETHNWGKLPPVCCNHNFTTTGYCEKSEDSNEKGCVDELFGFLTENKLLVGLSVGLAVAVEILAAAFACSLARESSQLSTYHGYYY